MFAMSYKRRALVFTSAGVASFLAKQPAAGRRKKKEKKKEYNKEFKTKKKEQNEQNQKKNLVSYVGPSLNINNSNNRMIKKKIQTKQFQQQKITNKQRLIEIDRVV